MDYLDDIDYRQPGFGDLYDELPLWSAPFGLLLLEHVPVQRGQTILDVGAGTGFLTLELAQRCGAGTTLIAVDPWGAGTERLRRKLERLGLSNVVLLEQDAEQLQLPDASVDLIVSNLGINNFENADAVLRTCWRVARPGAKLALTTNLTGHMAQFYDVYRETLIQLGRPECLEPLQAHIDHRGTVESVRFLLQRAGFLVVDTASASFPMRFADGSALLRHHFIRLGFVSGWKSIVPAAARVEVFAALERNLNALAAQRGELLFTIPVAYVEAIKVAPGVAAGEPGPA